MTTETLRNCGFEAIAAHDDEHDYLPSDLLDMPRAELAKLVLRHQQARWFERVGTRGTLQMIAQLREELVAAERDLELERRECSRLRLATTG
jgi:hypothetical protein